jgi:hypothetical protein
VLCCAVLCCAVLCCAVLCCAMLCYAMLCYAMLCYAMLCYAMLLYMLCCEELMRRPPSALSQLAAVVRHEDPSRWRTRVAPPEHQHCVLPNHTRVLLSSCVACAQDLFVMANCATGAPDERRHAGVYSASRVGELLHVRDLQPMPRLLQTARGRALAAKSIAPANRSRAPHATSLHTSRAPDGAHRRRGGGAVAAAGAAEAAPIRHHDIAYHIA